MKKVKEFVKSPKYKNSIKPELTRFGAVIFFTLIYGLGLKWFLEQSDIPMFTGGIPGFAQVLRDFIGMKNGDLFMSIFVFVANIPILLLGWFGVSKRFTLYSLVSVIIQSLVIGFIPPLELGLEGHALLASILGGLFIGVGIGGALKYGTSTGGFDIVAQWWSLKKGGSVGFVSMILNFVIVILGAAVAYFKNGNPQWGLILCYTVVRIIVSTMATDKVHTSYQFLSLEIITENPNDLVNHILHTIGRGVTLSKVQGAFSTHEKTLVMVVISSYELDAMTELIKQVDDKAFVVAKPVKSIIGNFNKKRIA